MMRKQLALAFLIVTLSFTTRAQHSLAFYHLGDATFQNSFYNPASLPEGKVFIGLPVLSGIHLNFNNKFSYSDFIGKSESGGSKIDLDKLLDSFQKNNMTSTTMTFSLFHFAVSTNTGKNFSIFANERIEMDLLYPKSLMQFAIKGNGDNLGETVKIGKTRMSATHFREIGLGYSMTVGKDLSIGVRAKYLQGFLNLSTPGNFTADLTTDAEDYSLHLDLHNATLRTSGMGVYQGESGNIATHMIMNNNRGGAIDLGFNYNLDRFNTISASLVDIGFISWKEDIKNHTYSDTTMVYSGIDLSEPDDLEQQIEDSLINKFKDRRTETYETFTTITSPKAYLSWTFHTPFGGDVIGTSGTRYTQGQLKWMFGAGYRQRLGNFLVGSVNVTKLPQQFLNLGGALSIKGGPAQMYLAVDHIMNFDVTKFQAFDFRFGINFIIGQRDPEILAKKDNGPKSKRTKTATGSFLGNKVDVKGQEGIYTIIDKQGRRLKSDYDVRVKPNKGDKKKVKIQTVEDPIPKESNRRQKKKPRKDF
ncbi:MAG: hypothetical protein JXR10_12560 [Cyclobacteriaceae bacterium]